MELQQKSDCTTKANVETLQEEVKALAETVRLLTEKIEALTPKPADERIPEEVLEVIAAAVAAYLGKRATVRFVRSAHADAESWAIQGRVAVQGSHKQ